MALGIGVWDAGQIDRLYGRGIGRCKGNVGASRGRAPKREEEAREKGWNEPCHLNRGSTLPATATA